MEPLFSYEGIDLTLVEICLWLAFLLLGVLITLMLSRRAHARQLEKQMESHALIGDTVKLQLTDMADKQAALQGRLSQFADDTAQRDAHFRESLDSRLSQVSEKVGASIVQTQERNSENLKQLHERLALIDRAQKNIETLSGEVSGLQSLLSNKQSRGAFGEKQMQDLIENYLPPNGYSFQATLSNGKRVDALIHLPSGQGDVELHGNFPEVIEKGFSAKVMIVSPTTFMATLHTMRAVMKDAAMREQAHIIQREVGLMAKDVTLLDDRVAKLQTHFTQTGEDMRKIRISTEKITKRADKIEALEMDEKPALSNVADFTASSRELKDTGS